MDLMDFLASNNKKTEIAMCGAGHIGTRMMELFSREASSTSNPTLSLSLSRQDNKFPLLISLYLVYNFSRSICGSEHIHLCEGARKALKYYKFYKLFLLKTFNFISRILKFNKNPSFTAASAGSKHRKKSISRQVRNQVRHAVSMERLAFCRHLYHSNPKSSPLM